MDVETKSPVDFYLREAAKLYAAPSRPEKQRQRKSKRTCWANQNNIQLTKMFESFVVYIHGLLEILRCRGQAWEQLEMRKRKN